MGGGHRRLSQESQRGGLLGPRTVEARAGSLKAAWPPFQPAFPAWALARPPTSLPPVPRQKQKTHYEVISFVSHILQSETTAKPTST